MGVNSDNIMKYREDYGIPNSDAFDTTSPSKKWNMPLKQFGRKRTGSEVSKSSGLRFKFRKRLFTYKSPTHVIDEWKLEIMYYRRANFEVI